jgi:hypothetical protein
MINFYEAQELTRLRMAELAREAEQAALVGRVGRSSRPGYRRQLALGLRQLAHRIDPGFAEPLGARHAWWAHS